MAVEVVTPEEFLGDVIGDLNKRRGHVEGQEPRGNALAVTASVPLGEMFGYATSAAFRDPGACGLLDAVRPLRGSAAEHRGGDRRARTGEPVGASA